MMHKKASTVSIGGVPTVYPGKGAAGSGSGSIWERKKVAAALTGGLLTTTSGKAVVGTATQKKAAAALSGGLPTTTPRKGAVGMAMKKKAAAALSGGLPTTNPGKGAVGTGSSGKMQKKATVVSSRGGSPRWGRDITNTERGRANGKTLLEPEASPRLPCGTGLPAATGERKHKNSSPSSPRNLSRVSLRQQLRASRAPALGSLTNVWDEINAHARAGSPLGARHANRTSHGSEESAPKHHAVEKTPKGPSGNMPQKGCTADTALRRGMLQKNQAKVKSGKGLGAQILHKKQSSSLQPDTGLNGKIPHEHPAKEAQTDPDETVHVEENIHLQETKLLIQKLNNLGLGEHISHEDFLVYYERLPNPPPSIDTDIELEAEKLRELGFRHALYRFQYCKYKLSKKGNNLEDDWPPNPFDGGAYGTRLKANDLLNIPEADCTPTFIEEQGYFKRFERDGTLDWSFPSDYINCALLNDYQRLVPRNYGGTEYIRWSEYHEYLHSYEIEQEYVEYCEELAKQLKWMEDYIHFDRPSFKYDFISSRGAYQAIKIAATGFREITPALAYNGYYECIESMGYDLAWLKELDCVYFEIWQRVTQGMSFKDALAEVCHLNRFPLSQDKMEHALEFDEAMEEMEEEFRICTAAITPEVKGDKARELIAGAVKELLDDTPKTYEQYIIKKMHIARVVGILPPKRIEDSEEWDNRQTSGCL